MKNGKKNQSISLTASHLVFLQNSGIVFHDLFVSPQIFTYGFILPTLLEKKKKGTGKKEKGFLSFSLEMITHQCYFISEDYIRMSHVPHLLFRNPVYWIFEVFPGKASEIVIDVLLGHLFSYL